MTMDEIRERVLRSEEITEFQRRVYLELLKEEGGRVCVADGSPETAQPSP